MLMTAGILLVVGVAALVAWPLLAPVPASEIAPAGGSTSITERSELAAARDRALAAIREAELDHATGRLSDDDYAIIRAELEGAALSALARLDQRTGGA